MKGIPKPDKEAVARAGDDLLRTIAGLPSRSVHVGRDQFRRRILVIQRNEFGRVVSSTEQIEEVEHAAMDADFFD